MPQGYQQLTVNHSLSFTKLLFTASENIIECIQQKFKNIYIQGLSVKRVFIRLYMRTFV